MKLERFAKGLLFPEGPVWLEDGSVVVVEIAGGDVRRCFPNGSSRIVASVGGGPNGAALGPDGALYVCNNGGMAFTHVQSRGWLLPGEQPDDYQIGKIQRVDLDSGEVRDLYTHCEGRPLRGPNDLANDGAGGFWFTDIGKMRRRDRDRGGVYHCSADGKTIREVLFPLDGPNGIAVSRDGRKLYVAETFSARVWAWEIEEPGRLEVRPHARGLGGDLLAGLGGYHLFDSMAVDPDGNVCVATFGDTCGITVISPHGGPLRTINLPGPMPTNICFSGDETARAYATLSPQGELVSWLWSADKSPE